MPRPKGHLKYFVNRIDRTVDMLSSKKIFLRYVIVTLEQKFQYSIVGETNTDVQRAVLPLLLSLVLSVLSVRHTVSSTTSETVTTRIEDGGWPETYAVILHLFNSYPSSISQYIVSNLTWVTQPRDILDRYGSENLVSTVTSGRAAATTNWTTRWTSPIGLGILQWPSNIG